MPFVTGQLPPAVPINLKLISCQVFHREAEAVIARAFNHVEVEFLPKGLHELRCSQMCERLQDVLDRVDPERFDAVAFAYGFCSHGLSGLRARTLPVIVPRAHDCITLLLGSRKRYLEEFEANPGTYYRSSGWLENRTNPDDIEALSPARRNGLYAGFEELSAQYGEENARYLIRELAGSAEHYSRFVFIETGLEPDDRFECETREDAQDRGWTFQKLRGDLALLQRLVDGDWKEDFLVLEPGRQIEPTYDDELVRASEPSSSDVLSPRRFESLERTDSQ